MTTADFTTSFDVHATPAEAFAAINDVPAWWMGEIVGPTHALGDEFTYRYEKNHFSRQRVTEFVPERRVVWLVVESRLTFVDQQNEWDGTRIVFDIVPHEGKTQVTFTHEGLEPAKPCYEACSGAWSYLMGCLRNLIAERAARPAVAAE